jgi:hypothetical protein
MAGTFCCISVATESGRGQKEDKGGIWLKERYQSDNFKLYSASWCHYYVYKIFKLLQHMDAVNIFFNSYLVVEIHDMLTWLISQ